MDISELYVGQKVRYLPKGVMGWENGIIKEIREEDNAVFVVYNCNDDWDNYQNYTAARTNLSDLKDGWKFL